MRDNIVEVRDMTVEFRKPRGALLAVNHVDFDIREGCVTALVGESGSGKSTLAFTVLNIVNTTGKILSGQVLYKGENILELDKDRLNRYRWDEVSMIFQSAQSALNPLMTIQEHFWETYHVHEPEAREEEVIPRFRKLLEDVRLDPDRVLKLYPHELSGGMKQRVMIAFSMLLQPKVIILDEPTTALDVITQDYIFSILDQIHRQTGVSMLLLTHDIGVVAKVADRIAVMYAGRIVEVGDIFEVFYKTAHPYARALITTAPSLLDRGEDKEPIQGVPPDLIDLPAGCAFHPRCPYATDLCRTQVPALQCLGEDHQAACHHIERFRKEAGIHV